MERQLDGISSATSRDNFIGNFIEENEISLETKDLTLHIV